MQNQPHPKGGTHQADPPPWESGQSLFFGPIRPRRIGFNTPSLQVILEGRRESGAVDYNTLNLVVDYALKEI